MKRFQIFTCHDEELIYDSEFEADTLDEVLGKLHDTGALEVDYIIVDMKTVMTCQVIREVSEVTEFSHD